jgi:DNA-binding MarR family transcriptional regulator
MTTMVRFCERDGLVIRQRDTDDGRAFRIYLTNRAKSFRPVAEQVLHTLDQAVLTALGERQRAALARALKGVMDL